MSPSSRRTSGWGTGWALSTVVTGMPAVRALIGYSRQVFEVAAVWAGVKEANLKSRAVLERVGFSVVEILPTHVRYRLVCDDG